MKKDFNVKSWIGGRWNTLYCGPFFISELEASFLVTGHALVAFF